MDFLCYAKAAVARNVSPWPPTSGLFQPVWGACLLHLLFFIPSVAFAPNTSFVLMAKMFNNVTVSGKWPESVWSCRICGEESVQQDWQLTWAPLLLDIGVLCAVATAPDEAGYLPCLSFGKGHYWQGVTHTHTYYPNWMQHRHGLLSLSCMWIFKNVKDLWFLTLVCTAAAQLEQRVIIALHLCVGWKTQALIQALRDPTALFVFAFLIAWLGAARQSEETLLIIHLTGSNNSAFARHQCSWWCAKLWFIAPPLTNHLK